MQPSLFGDLDITDKPYILISLKESMHRKILAGKKKYEYRKGFIKTAANVFVYVSDKKKCICAYAEFAEPIIGSMDQIIKVNQNDVLPNAEGVLEYFKNKKDGYAIPIKKYYEIGPVTLEELRSRFPGFAPPQSYIFLKKKQELLDFLLQLKKGGNGEEITY